MLLDIGLWIASRDCDPWAFDLFRRHYSYREYADGRRDDPRYSNRWSFLGPGDKTVLLTPTYDALFAWRKFKDDSGQQGVNCAVFRNEGPTRSSELILAAEDFATNRWPGQRVYTYVDPTKVASSNPGYCFLMAGWRKCGTTASGLIVLDKQPPASADSSLLQTGLRSR
jgi:hypothetical protein